ncbi:Hsp20/alpha crystallin family protein [Niveibacterium sp. 24ML]|uniref:Hsp20/alpha crystallin family protein n=1 Tax=Niveibacterium sp. 24ML TaxID=2985512 RepID=UPI00226E9F51|nr:Hsp20/alpha crystallin family protein [Niveibacterium sp. 24ML]MCX9157360.1 Hsp20/alpha crystallin family protein [Niveibacterium sp. 24ML]
MNHDTMNPARQDDTLLPAVDVIEDPQGILLLADLPGVSKEGLSIHVEGDVLSLAGTIVLPVPEGASAIHTEVSAPRYHRAFTLSRELDAERIEAQFKHGELRLRIPKKTHAQTRRVEITID